MRPRVRRAAKHSPKEPSIGQVLDDLGIDKDIEPDVAARQHQQELQERYDNISKPFEEDDSPKDEIPEAIPISRGRKTKEVVKPATTTDAPVPPVAEEELRAPPVAPKPIKPQAPARSPSTGRLGKGLSALVPGAERLKVYKRLPNGQLGHVGAYTLRDLQGCSDVEDFLHQHVVENHGFGEYSVRGIDAAGRNIDVGSVTLLGSKQEKQGDLGGLTSLMSNFMTQQQNWMREERERMMGAPQQKDPVEMLQGVMSISEAATRGAKIESEKAVQAAAESQSNFMQMFIAMQQSSQQQMTALLTTLAQPKEDPTMKVLLAKLLEEKSGGSALPPPPPPPPPVDPMDGLAKLLTALVPLLAAFGVGNSGGGGGGGDDDFKTFLREMLLKTESDRFTARDMIEMFKETKSERGTDDFKKSADNFAMMMSLANQMRQSTEAGPASSLWDAVAALLGNRDVAGAIARSVESKASSASQQLSHQQQLQLAQQQRAFAIAQQQRADAHQRAQRMIEAQQRQQQPSQVQAPPVSAPSVPASTPRPVPIVQLPPLPSDATDYVNKIIVAETDAEILRATVSFLQYLADYDEWKKIVFSVMSSAREGDKKAMMNSLVHLFEGFRQIGLIDTETAKRALGAAHREFDAIYSTLSGEDSLPGEEDEDSEPADYLDALEDDEDDEDEGEEDEGQ